MFFILGLLRERLVLIPKLYDKESNDSPLRLRERLAGGPIVWFKKKYK